MSDDSYQPRMTPDGKENPQYVDLLEEDKPIANQKNLYVCLLFLQKRSSRINRSLISRSSSRNGNLARPWKNIVSLCIFSHTSTISLLTP